MCASFDLFARFVVGTYVCVTGKLFQTESDILFLLLAAACPDPSTIIGRGLNTSNSIVVSNYANCTSPGRKLIQTAHKRFSENFDL